MTTTRQLPLSALLRNTALEASLLAQGTTTASVPQLREQCLKLVREFDAALDARKVSDDVRDDALYMQCGLLDETVLSNLPVETRGQWDTHPLQVERFSKHDAGEHVFDRLAVRMCEAPANVELLECYAMVLGLGFKGRYARGGEARRIAIIDSLHDLLAKTGPASAEGLIVDAARTRRSMDWLRRLSPWALAGLACAAAMVIFVAVGQSLEVQASHLMAPKS